MITVLLNYTDFSDGNSININARNNKGETPLHLVCRNSNYEILRIMLDKVSKYDNISFDFNIQDNFKQAPIHFICSNERMSNIVFNMISASEISSIDFNLQNNELDTPMHLMCKNGSSRMMETIFEKLSSSDVEAIDFNKKNRRNESPIHIICQNSNTSMLRIILDKLQDISPVSTLSKYSKIDFNLKSNCGQTPIHIICGNDCVSLLKVILEKLSDNEKSQIDFNLKNDYGQTPIHIICRNNCVSLLKIIFEKLSDNEKSQIDFNIKDNSLETPIHSICKSGNDDILQFLLESDLRAHVVNIDYNQSNRNGESPIHFICQSGNKNMLNYILNTSNKSKIDFNMKNNSGNTPIHFICSHNYVKLLNIIFDKLSQSEIDAIDLNIKNNKGETPLHFASSFDVPSNMYINHINNDNFIFIDKYKTQTVFGILLERGVDINILDSQNEFPLHVACRKQCFNNIDILLKKEEQSIDGITKSTPLLTLLSSLIKNKYQPEKYITRFEREHPNFKRNNSNQNRNNNGLLLNNTSNRNYQANNNNRNQSSSDNSDVESANSNSDKLIKPEEPSSSDNESYSSFEPAKFEYLRSDINYNYHNFGNMSFTQNSLIIKAISSFINRGANYQLINKDGISLLLFGIISQIKRIVDFCMKNIVESRLRKLLNHLSDYGKPIDLALEYWNTEILELLFDKKKLITFNEKIRNEIIYKCVMKDETYVLLLLLDQDEEEKNDPNLDFNVNYTLNNNNQTLLHLLVERNNYIGLNILSNYRKTKVNVLSKDGKSALHEACDSNDRNGYLALSILTKIDYSYLHEFLLKNRNSPSLNNLFFDYLKSELTSSINDKVNINCATKGLTRTAYFRRERQKILARNPGQTYFHIYYNEPRFNNGFIALHISIANQIYYVVKKILSFPELNINAFTSNCDTAVSIAAKNWNVNIIKLLLDYPEIDLNFVPQIDDDDDEYDDYGNKKEKNQPDNDDDDKQPHTLTSAELYEIKQKKMKQNKTILHTACERNSIEIVKYLLDLCKQGTFDVNGVDSFDGMAPLHYICQDSKYGLLNLFIEFEENNPGIIDWNLPNNNGMTPLHLAARAKNYDVVDILINNEFVCPHVDINAVATGEFEEGRTPISFACEKGDFEIVSLLLDEEIEKEKDDEEEEKIDPFSFEANQKQVVKPNKKKVVRGSLCGAKSKCDLSIKSKAAHSKGMSPLHYACKASNADVVKLLLKHIDKGFNINVRANGRSCLFLACKHDRVETVKLLLQQNGKNYNIKTPTGVTPLMIAAENGRWKVVEILMQLPEIDVDALTVDGQSARSMAKNHDIVDLIDKYS